MLCTNMQMLEERSVSAEAQEAILTPGGRHRAGLCPGQQEGAYPLLPRDQDMRRVSRLKSL